MLDTAKADCLAISSKRDLRIANSTQMKGGIKKMMNFRKIVSVLTSAAMLGSTVALATAASYPQPFVKNGMADAAVVYGSSAATTDVVAALDIHKQLTSQLLKEAIVTPSSSGSSVSTSGGDSINLAKSNQKLYTNSTLNSAFSSVTNTELPTLLASGTAVDAAGTSYGYTQKITPGARQVVYGKSGESIDPVAMIDAGSSGTNPTLSYTLAFSKAINITDTTNVVGTAAIKILGKEYTIGANSDATNLYLYGSGASQTVEEGETKTVTIDKKEHTISLKGTSSSTAATIIVNGVSKSVNKGSSYKFAGDFEVYIKDLFHATKTGTLSNAVLLVGSQTIHFVNNSQIRLGSGDDILLQGTNALISTTGTTLTSLTVNQSFSDSTNDYIKVGESFTDRVFGGAFKLQFASLSPSLNDSKDMIVVDTDNSVNGRVKILTKAASDKGITDPFTFYYGRDSDATSNNALPGFRLADSNNYTIHVLEGANLSVNDYILVNSGDKGRILQLQSITQASPTTANNVKVTFKDAVTSELFSVTTTDSNGSTTNTIDSESYSVYVEGVTGKGVNITWGSGSAPGAVGSQRTLFPRIKLANGGWFTILSAFNVTNATTYSVPGLDSLSDYQSGVQFLTNGGAASNVSTGKVTYEIANLSFGQTLTSVLVGTTRCSFNNFNVTYPTGGNNVTYPSAAISGPAILYQEQKTATGSAATNGEVICIPLQTEDTSPVKPAAGTPVFSDQTSLSNLVSTNTKSQSLTTFGTLVEHDTASSNVAKLWLSNSQMEANILITSPTTTVIGGSSGSGGAATVTSVFTVTDAEVTSVSSKNLVVVGGSCINTVAAKLLGSTTPLCGADFMTKTGADAGSYVLQTFESPYTAGKVATLVAGYNAADTTNGVKFLTTQTNIDVSVGKKYLNGVVADTTAALKTNETKK